MHSTKKLSASSFSVTVNGRPGRLADIFPGFTEQDRVALEDALGLLAEHGSAAA